jgi:hypothetical protein
VRSDIFRGMDSLRSRDVAGRREPPSSERSSLHVVQINTSDFVTGLAVAIASALLRWGSASCRSAIAAGLNAIAQVKRHFRLRASVQQRERWIREAELANESVVIRHEGRQPTKAIFDGACSGETFHFNGDYALYRRSMHDRRVPHARSYPGRPPRVGTRRPCPC